MFDIGWSELVVIAVVALIAIGPKELPGVLRMVGQWMGKARKMAAEFQGQFNEAMREAEMADLKKTFDDVRDAARDLTSNNIMTSLQRDVSEAMTIDKIDNVDTPVTTPTTPEPPTPVTLVEETHASTSVEETHASTSVEETHASISVEAETHASQSEPLAITQQAGPQPVPYEAPSEAVVDIRKDAKAS
jgi:sec-independent protein translocase protein TatB